MSIEAMKQALSLICSARLCEVNSMSSRQEMLRLMIEATDTLRAAIKEEEKPWVKTYANGVPQYTTQEKQPEQEPVAWMHNTIEGNVITHRPADIDRHPERWTPLYTAPPHREWQGLTDDDIAQAMYRADAIVTGPMQFNFARAIEVKLKEKNT